MNLLSFARTRCFPFFHVVPRAASCLMAPHSPLESIHSSTYSPAAAVRSFSMAPSFPFCSLGRVFTEQIYGGMLKDQILFQEESNSPPGAVPCLLAGFRLTAFLKLANLPAQRDCSVVFIRMPVIPSQGGQFLCLIACSLVNIVYSCPLYFETCASLFGRGKNGIGHFLGCHRPLSAV